MHWPMTISPSIGPRSLAASANLFRQLARRVVDGILKLVTAGVARPHVSDAMIGEVLRPFGLDQIRTTLRALINRFHRMPSFNACLTRRGQTALAWGRNKADFYSG